jgi:putative ABC transport system permease protein
MFRNYILTALRNLKRYKSYSLINLVGLSVGLAATILIFSFINHELSYDRFHEKHDRIYRIGSLLEMAGDHSVKGPVSLGSLPPLLKDAIPEISYVTRVDPASVEVIYDNQRFFNNKRLIVDDSFLDIFTFRVTDGNVVNPLSEPGTIVITERLAQKIFGQRSAIGEIFSINNRDYTVNAVTEDVPVNSHLKFDLLMSVSSLSLDEEQFLENKGFDLYAYFLLKEGVNHNEALENANVYITDYYDELLKGMGLRVTPFFQQLTRIHLYSEDIQFQMEPGGRISNIYTFAFLAMFIMLIAIVNHINLVTARAETRSREVALRKIAGSSRYNLISQFISESFFVTLISLAISISIVELLIHPFGNLMGRELAINWFSPLSALFIIAITLITGTGAGAYPAFYLSGFSPLKIFQKQSGSRPGNLLKVILVVFQFGISIFLIICLIILYSQTSYMHNKNLGFNRENVLIIGNMTPGISESFSSVKDKLLKNTLIRNVTASEGIPGQQASIQNSWQAGGSRDDAVMVFENRVQDDYFETFRIPVIQGRTFKEGMEGDRNAFVINESAARALGLSDPVGKEIYVWERRGTIIGVVSDFHFESLHEPIKPIVHSRYSDRFTFISLRVSPQNISQTIASTGETLKDFDPDFIYNYIFLDDRLRQSYEAEERNNKLISMSALLAIILSVMGLYSLTSFTILRKTKEMGIRKAMGSSTASLLIMLYKDMGQWVLVANIIAWPSACYFMSRWLENFAYRTEIEAWMFIAGGLVAMVVAMLTITHLAVRAALINPVEALRYE